MSKFKPEGEKKVDNEVVRGAREDLGRMSEIQRKQSSLAAGLRWLIAKALGNTDEMGD
ncbi:hypothetical protein KA119_02425 [Candidatus Gracilibacteria bacterium]|nr:hypothetical protein [Candidatus Gracilibacteria bacterium]